MLKNSFLVTNKDISKSWTQQGTHSTTISLSVHNVVETEFNQQGGCLHQLSKNFPAKWKWY